MVPAGQIPQLLWQRTVSSAICTECSAFAILVVAAIVGALGAAKSATCAVVTRTAGRPFHAGNRVRDRNRHGPGVLNNHHACRVARGGSICRSGTYPSPLYNRSGNRRPRFLWADRYFWAYRVLIAVIRQYRLLWKERSHRLQSRLSRFLRYPPGRRIGQRTWRRNADLFKQFP